MPLPDPANSIQGGKAWHKCPGPRGMILGEAPIYRASDSTLHWVDCLADPAELHILHIDLDPETGDPGDETTNYRVVELPDSVTVAFFRRDHPGSYICAYFQGVAFLDEKTGQLDILKEIIPTSDRAIRRFNDGAVDAKGRFWLAEIDRKAMAYGPNQLPKEYGEPIGRLWRYDPDGSLHEMEQGIICGNGLAWSPDNKTMYFNDSVAMIVYAYDFDLESGNISNRRILIDRRDSFGEPDGMVVDTDGNLWIAMFGTYRVMVFDPQGHQIRDIVFAAKNMACTTWGGKDGNTLYIASGHDKTLTAAQDEGGHIYHYQPEDGVQGTVKHAFAG